MKAISSLDGCKGMRESYEECLLDGHCPSCEQYAGVDTVTFTNTESVVVSKPKEPDTEPDTTDTNARPVPVEEPEEEEPVETSKPTPAPIVPRPGIALPVATVSPTIKEVSQTDSPSSLTSVFIKQSSSPTEPATLEQSPQPTSTPITGKPSPSPVNSPSQEPTSGSPSYTPTTPQPTFGSCDGESCPDDMCRSAYGFCGHGENYCTDKAIWSPECKTNSKPPTPSPISKTPTSSPVKQATPILNDVFSVTPAPVQLITTEPPVSLDKGSYAKPSGGKGSGNPKPSGSSSSPPQVVGDESNTIPVNTNSPMPYPVTPSPIGGQRDTPLPTFKPTNKEWSPTDPEATYFCGLNWADANIACSVRCPSSKSDECPDDQKCFAFTSCMQQKKEKTSSRPTDQPSDQPIYNESVTPTPTIPTQTNTPGEEGNENTDVASFDAIFQPVAADDSETEVTTDIPQDSIKPEGGCEGAPCPFEGECRSQYGFCGVSFIYCNALSSWTLENCGLAGADVDKKGDFNMLCEVMTKTCPTGEEVYRDPSNECEYFPCPSDEEDIDEITSSAFSIPGMGKAPSPATLPNLPVPTLPTITKSTPFTLPTVDKPSGMTIDLGKQSAESSDTTEIVVDDEEEEEEVKDSTGDTPKYSLNDFDEWFYSSADLSQTLSLLLSFMVPILTFFAM